MLYIIAGPPGIGKSTSGDEFINPDLDILNEDEMRFRYKAEGYADYNEYSIHRVREAIRRMLIRNEDFALELNLGYSHQYEYILSTKKFRAENKLHIILFFTDDIDLCLIRAKERHESGRHLVKPEIIREMYANTLPLLKDNFDAIDGLILLDANDDMGLTLIANYEKEAGQLSVHNDGANWFNNDLKPFIESRILM
ncbi:MAG: putative ABC-type ATPase [Mucilaginibacter sp.]|nr:putative ABC-type ATPase [Mucilaginibacter sp.]